ncbi:MAG TPA: NADH-quinone oxidoreductase subunit NuoG [Thermoleophilia bacterium]|nr:NADH-quinone oxidoreductase subunit NuoG [Thermoleophilia bacterium]
MSAERNNGAPQLVTVIIDGREFQAEAGRNMLDVALSFGFDLPFFCWHPLMGSIGACRQCAVRLYWTGRDGEEKSEIAMACMTEAQEGTRIDIDDEEAVRFRAEMIELMMLSHPHDCPVCDEGGECHLQDMTVMTGHSYRRYAGLKRTFPNQDLGPFVTHEMNRCITCYRCTRLYNDYAGGHDFGVFGLRDQIYFGRDQDGTLESEFSGNLVEVCPTGVFTDKTLAGHYSRKWDLQTAPSVCPHCGLGCSTTPGARDGELRRVVSRYSRAVNKMFLCDRGRYGYEYVNAPQRIRAARVAWRPASQVAGQASAATRREQALDAAAVLLRSRRAIGIGSPRVSLEDNYALRALVGADHFYLGLSETDYDLVGDVIAAGGGAGAQPGLPPGALADVQDADAVFILGEDLTNTAPMLDLTVRTWLRLRPTAQEERVHIRRWNDAAIGRAKRREPSALWIAAPQAGKLDELAAEAWQAAPDDIARLALALAHEVDPASPAVADLSGGEQKRVTRWAEALRGSRRPVIVGGVSGGSRTLLRAAANLARVLGATAGGGVAASGTAAAGGAAPARLILTVPEPNSVGLRMMGGGRLPQAIAAVARGEADTVVILDNDLYRRTASLLVDDLFRREPDVLALAPLEDPVTAHAGVVLPSATVAESTGTFVNNEGRAQRFFSVLAPTGETREAWRWLRDLMGRLDRQEARGWLDVDDVIAALEHELPQFRGVAAAAPGADWRLAGSKVARQPRRFSGRTAMDADASVREPAPDIDRDSALAYSLEGAGPDQSPAALLPRTWSPGWDSASGLHKLQEEVNGPLRNGPVGARLLDRGFAGGVGAGRLTGSASAAGAAAGLPAPAVPAAFAARPDEFLLLPLHHIYGSDDRSMYTPGVLERTPTPYIALCPADAERLELAAGDWLELWQPWMDVRAPFRLLPSLPEGVAGVPAGLPGMPFLSLPGRGRLTRCDAPPSQQPAGQTPAQGATWAPAGAAWAPTGATWKPDDAPDVEAKT